MRSSLVALCATSVSVLVMVLALQQEPMHPHVDCRVVVLNFLDFKYSAGQGYGSDVHPEQFLERFTPAWRRHAVERCISGQL